MSLLRRGRARARSGARRARASCSPSRASNSSVSVDVAAASGLVVRDRDAALGGLRIADRSADHASRRPCRRSSRARAAERSHAYARVRMSVMFSATPSHSQALVEVFARELHHLEHLLDTLQGEVLALRADQRMACGHERVRRQQPERRRTVDQDQVVTGGAPRAAPASASARVPSCRSARAPPRRARGWPGSAVVNRVHGARRGRSSTSPIVGEASGSTSK